MSDGVTRRGFLLRTAGVSISAVAAPYVLTSNVLAKPGRPGANERIILGYIGIGGRGWAHLTAAEKEDVAAVCDVDTRRLERAVKHVGKRVQGYQDYRRLLERKDIDAVIIASPPHWHGLQTVHACQAGKDVYCERPASRTIEEGRAMVEAARRYGRVVQVGSLGPSTPAAYSGAAFLRNRQIGQVNRVTAWHYQNPVGVWRPNTDPPVGLDWDLWLGPARWRPYNEDWCHFNFRWVLELGGGHICQHGADVFSVVLFCMGEDAAGPVSVEASGSPPPDGPWDCPVSMEVKYEFRDPDWTLIWSQPGEPLGDPFGAKYWGDKGTLIVRGGDGGCETEEKAMQYKVPSGGSEPYRSPGHKEDWLECIRTRKRPIMDLEAGHRAGTLGIIGNIAYRLGRKLRWDASRERFVGDEEANRMLGEPGRGMWHL